MPVDEEEHDDSNEEEQEDDVPDYSIGQIFVNDLNGNTLTLDDITTNTTIIKIKHMIQLKNGLAPEDQRLMFAGKMLKDDHTVGYCKIQKDESINLSLPLRGGGKRGRATAGTKDDNNITRAGYAD